MNHTYIDALQADIVNYLQFKNIVSNNSIFQYRQCAAIYIADGNPVELMVGNVLVRNLRLTRIIVYKKGCYSKILGRIIACANDIDDWHQCGIDDFGAHTHRSNVTARTLAETRMSGVNVWTENISGSTFKIYECIF